MSNSYFVKVSYHNERVWSLLTRDEKFMPTSEVMSWFLENLKIPGSKSFRYWTFYRNAFEDHGLFEFQYLDDAILFKMTFGGDS